MLVIQSFFLESTNMIETKMYCTSMVNGWSLIKLAFIYRSENRLLRIV